MDFATIIGIISGTLCVIVSIVLNGSLLSFFDLPSIFIVIGGGMASVLISYRLNEVGTVMKVAVKAFSSKDTTYIQNIRLLTALSKQARRDGLLSLENELENIDDDFISQTLQLVVDGVAPEIIKDTMDLELDNLKTRHDKGQAIFKSMGSLFPAWGMIGTLIGLIKLLDSLNEPSKIGPSMAVALITTFYGSMLANFVCIPIASKLAIKSAEEIRMKEMIVEGMLSIQSGENTRLLEHKLKTFLSPEQKLQYSQESALLNDKCKADKALEPTEVK